MSTLSEEEIEIIEERVYVVPFYPKLKYVPRWRRTPRAIRMLREFVKRHMKAEGVIISEELNEFIWSRGSKKPPRKVRVKCSKDKEGVVEVRLAEAGTEVPL